MAGHSGAGAALSDMANGGQAGAIKPGESSALPDDLVIYDAINGWAQRNAFVEWATRRLDEDLAILTDADDRPTEAKLVHLNRRRSCAATRPTPTSTSTSQLDKAIESWFDANRAELGQWAGCLRANFHLEYLDLHHEELMRGSSAAGPRAAGTGTILDAIKALHTRARVGRRLPRVAAVAPGALLGDPPRAEAEAEAEEEGLELAPEEARVDATSAGSSAAARAGSMRAKPCLS